MQYVLTNHIYIRIHILYNILFQTVLDLTVTKLSLGTKIHSKPQIRKLTDTYRFFFTEFTIWQENILLMFIGWCLRLELDIE